MTEITLSQAEMQRLIAVYNRVPDLKFYTLRQSNTSGIGPNLQVLMDIFDVCDGPDTTVDITDVSTW